MAQKNPAGIKATAIKYGRGISAARALPKSKADRPAVIILHERYGIDQHTKDLTARLAQAGFVGLAPDLFHRFNGDRKAVLRGEQRVDLTDDGALEDLNAAIEYLKKLKAVDDSRIAILVCAKPGGNLCCSPQSATISPARWVLYGAIGEKNGSPTIFEELIPR